MGAPRVSGRPGREGLTAATAMGIAVAVVLTGLSAPVARASAAAASPQGPPPAHCNDPVLPGPTRGDAAFRALGTNVTAVAARNRTNPSELARHLHQDRTLWVDPCGALFFQDELPADLEPAPESAEGTGWPAVVAPANAFGLHSRPGSKRVLFLDFDGFVISGTGWNTLYSQDTWTAPAFSTDADPTTFTDAERAVVTDVWRRVAQDYAAFDVDVTTQDPGQDLITRSGSTDVLFGTRVLISPDATQSQCGCGGRAYVDVVDRTSGHAQYQPAWVYPQALSNSSKYIAEAASHEAGHNFGLSHDGTQTAAYYAGAGGWGPIMGSPYSQPVTQWNNGTYAGANNLEDDLAIIAGNGAPLVPDDITQPAALPLPGSVTGLVNGTSDVDAFTVSAPDGTLTVTAAPHWPGPNLDVALTLRDSNGVVVASAAPAYDATRIQASVGAVISVAVAAGTYAISLEGSGNGLVGSAGESDYGSIGWYTLSASTTGTPTPTPTPTPTSTPTPTPTPTPSPTLTTPTPTPSPTLPSASPTPSPTLPSASPTPSPTLTSASPTPSPTLTTASPSPTPTATKKPTGKRPRTPEQASLAAPLSVRTSTLPTAARKKHYSAVLVAAGGSAPYRWKRSKGSLPKGLRLTRSGAVSGTARAKVTKRFRVRVTDSLGATSLRWVTLRVR